MVETPITYLSQGQRLVGMIHHPLRGNGVAVVLCHGFTSHKGENKRLFVETAREFCHHGFMSLRFDFFGSGDSAGEFHQSRISINRQNLKDTLALVRGMGYDTIVVLGISMGAATAVVTLADEAVQGVVLWSTVPEMRALFEAKLGTSLEEAPVRNSYEYEGWLIDREFFLDAIAYDIPANLKQLTIPKLMIQGSRDDPLFTRGFEALKAIARPPVEFTWIEGAGHTYDTVRHRKQVIETTLRWLQNHF